MSSSWIGWCVLVAIGSVACGSSVETGDGGAGGECKGFEDAEPGAPTTFRFVNQAAFDIYLKASCDELDYKIEPSAGSDGTYYGRVGGACQQSCEDLQTSERLLCEAAACAATSYRIPAGGTLEVDWDGRGQKPVEMPNECFKDPSSSDACSQIVAAEGGNYKLSIEAYSACGSDSTACTCDANGLCDGEATGQSAFTNPISFSLPANLPVEYVFDACAFGCAEPG